MIGLPLVPCHEFPTEAPAGFFSIHAMKDPDLATKLAAFIAAGKPVLITDGLAAALAGKVELNRPNVQILPVKGDPKSLLKLPQEQIDTLRAPLLKPLNIAFRAPVRVALYPFKDGSFVIENFGDEPATADISGTSHTIAARLALPVEIAPRML